MTCADWTSDSATLSAQIGHSDGLGPGMSSGPPLTRGDRHIPTEAVPTRRRSEAPDGSTASRPTETRQSPRQKYTPQMFGPWRRKSSLDQIRSRSRVKLQARVVSPNVVESPLTGLRAAALEWLFFVRSVNHSFGQAEYPLHDVRQLYHPVGSRRLGEELMLESGGKLIRVSLRDAVLRFPNARESSTLVYRDLSSDLCKSSTTRPRAKGRWPTTNWHCPKAIE